MASNMPHEIVLSLDNVDQLFNAPDVKPFSHKEVDLLGESALSRVIRRILAWRLRSRAIKQLILLLPASQIEPDIEDTIAAAVRRYCHAKIEDNRLQIRTTLIQGFMSLLAVIVAVIILAVAVAYLFLSGIVSPSSPQSDLLIFTLSVVAWVTLWDPVESLAFEWVPAHRENRALRAIIAMRVAVREQAAEDAKT